MVYASCELAIAYAWLPAGGNCSWPVLNNRGSSPRRAGTLPQRPVSGCALGAATTTSSDRNGEKLHRRPISALSAHLCNYIAEQIFRTSANGERLFYRGGPWSRPYIIPDAATERRIYSKHLVMLRVLYPALILGQPLLFMLRPDLLHEADRLYVCI